MDANSLTSSMKTPPLLLVVKVVIVLVVLVSATLSNVANVIVDLDAASLTKPVPVVPTVVTVDETVVAQVSENEPRASFKFLTFLFSSFFQWVDVEVPLATLSNVASVTVDPDAVSPTILVVVMEDALTVTTGETVVTTKVAHPEENLLKSAINSRKENAPSEILADSLTKWKTKLVTCGV
jgi:hypothetical protein